MEYKIVGDEIWVNGFKIADIKPAKALSVVEIENFKDYIRDSGKNISFIRTREAW